MASRADYVITNCVVISENFKEVVLHDLWGTHTAQRYIIKGKTPVNEKKLKARLGFKAKSKEKLLVTTSIKTEATQHKHKQSSFREGIGGIIPKELKYKEGIEIGTEYRDGFEYIIDGIPLK